MVYNGYEGEETFVLPETVEFVGYAAFENCGFKFADVSVIENADGFGLSARNGSSAFKNCAALEVVVLNNRLGKIPANMFEGCSALKELDLSDFANLTEISDYAFYRSGLATVALPTALQVVGESAFEETKITEIALPYSVSTLN